MDSIFYRNFLVSFGKWKQKTVLFIYTKLSFDWLCRFWKMLCTLNAIYRNTLAFTNRIDSCEFYASWYYSTMLFARPYLCAVVKTLSIDLKRLYCCTMYRRSFKETPNMCRIPIRKLEMYCVSNFYDWRVEKNNDMPFGWTWNKNTHIRIEIAKQNNSGINPMDVRPIDLNILILFKQWTITGLSLANSLFFFHFFCFK